MILYLFVAVVFGGLAGGLLGYRYGAAAVANVKKELAMIAQEVERIPMAVSGNLSNRIKAAADKL